MANDFKKGESFSVAELAKAKVKAFRTSLSTSPLVDVSILVSIGLSIYTLSPWFIGASVLLVLIKEAKDFFVSKEVDARLDKMEETLNISLLEFDEKLSALNSNISKLNSNDQAISKDLERVHKETLDISKETKKELETQKAEFNRYMLKQRALFGNDQ